MRPHAVQRTKESSGKSITGVQPSDSHTGQQARNVVRAAAAARMHRPYYAPRVFARRRLLLGSVILSIAACRTPGSFTPRTDGVDVRNTLEPLVQAVRAAPDDRTAGEAWSKYLAEGGMPADGVKPEALGKAIRASLPQLESISASGPSEVREVASAVGALHGRSVKARVSLEALREDVPVLKKIHLSDGQAPVALDWRRG